MRQHTRSIMLIALCVGILLTATACGGGAPSSSVSDTPDFNASIENGTTASTTITGTGSSTSATTAGGGTTTTTTAATEQKGSVPTKTQGTTTTTARNNQGQSRPVVPSLPNEPMYLGYTSSNKAPIETPNRSVSEITPRIDVASASGEARARGYYFANSIAANKITGFRWPGDSSTPEGDKMTHVSTYTQIQNYYYMTYYANTDNVNEHPDYQMARLVYCPTNNVNNKTYINLQKVGDKVGNKTVTGVYDTILLQKDDRTLYLMWTARLSSTTSGGDYYRLYRLFDTDTKTLGEVRVNRLQVNGQRVDFCINGMKAVFAEQGIPYRTMFSDIGIMQKLTSRVEGGEMYYYTGAYCGNMTFIIKSKDLFTWEYVAQPDFDSATKWENAVYVIGYRAYYFVRQENSTNYGILTYYDLEDKSWASPVLVEDSQSRSDFIMYNGELYLFYAPTNRQHIGILHVNQSDLKRSNIVVYAQMQESCFYPFVQYCGGEWHFSYTWARKDIYLSKFDPEYILMP